MEYNQDTGLASVSGTAVTGWPHVSIRWRYDGDGLRRGLRGREGETVSVRFRRLLLTGHLAAIISSPLI